MVVYGFVLVLQIIQNLGAQIQEKTGLHQLSNKIVLKKAPYSSYNKTKLNGDRRDNFGFDISILNL